MAFGARMHAALLFIAAMMNSRGALPAIGDSDDGKVFSFGGDGAASAYEAMLRAGAVLFGCGALQGKLAALGVNEFAERSWLVLPSAPAPVPTQTLPTVFKEGGYLILGDALHTPAEWRATLDVGALGYNRIAGHGHADSLALVLAVAGEDFLIDPGTFCYNAAPELRHYFRGTAAHNTVLIDGVDQSLYGGSFLWLRDVATTIHAYQDDGTSVMVEASHDGYLRLADPVRHIRTVTLNRAMRELVVLDRFECARSHRCSVHWHFASECVLEGGAGHWIAARTAGQLAVTVEAAGFEGAIVRGRESPPLGWVSRAFYQRQPTPVLVLDGMVVNGATVTTRFTYSAGATPR